MARSRKPRKVVADEAEETTGDEAEAPQRTAFMATLRSGVTYETDGMVFRAGIPMSVPIKHLKKFQANGWFTVSL